jgi:putative ABC transport system ATP-binding protein
LIQIKELTKNLRGGGHRVDILNGIDLEVSKGQFLAITGPSGSGKTTLLSLIAGLDSPTSGSIIIDGQDITKLNEDQLAYLRNARFGFVFQNFHLIPTLTALENVRLATELNDSNHGEERSQNILKQVGLDDRVHHYPSQLSGGEQQRLSIARAFVNEPDIVLADEPTGNLDSKNTEKIMELITQLHQSRKATIVMVTHEPKVAKLSERILIFNDGRIVEDAIPEKSSL